jgi:hypothetical protein
MWIERFANAKAEAYWGLRECMERGEVCRLNDLETEAQLSAILYRATPSGKTEIESKEEARPVVAQSRRGPRYGVLQDCAARTDHRFQPARRDLAVLNRRGSDDNV